MSYELAPGEREIVYPANAELVVDVTKAPYFLDNTGQADCTEKLIRIMDEIANSSLDALDEIVASLESDPDPNARSSFENRKENGWVIGIFPEHVPVNRIIYFPKGEYLVSDTICYSSDKLVNTQGAELNWCIRFVGESRSGTVIRLQDSCHGFEYGMGRPVISFIRGRWSNIAMSNYCENLTIDTGSGNPGAVGLDFFGNNCAAVRDVTVRSSDVEHRGQAGISVTRETISGCLFSNIEVDGFDYGIMLSPLRTYVVLENVIVRNQRVSGMLVKHMIVPVGRLQSFNRVPAITIEGHSAHVSLIDSQLTGGCVEAPAIDFQGGFLFMRNCDIEGYRCCVGERRMGSAIVSGNHIDQYTSHPAICLDGDGKVESLALPIEQRPSTPVIAMEKWLCVNDCGAVGDGVADDSAAIQRAMDSAKEVIFFQPGIYLVDQPVRIPSSVRLINFMFADLAAGERIKTMQGAGMFVVAEDSDEPLFMEDLFARERNYGEHYLIDHASMRTLVLSDLHSQSCSMYRNSVSGGKVFLDNVLSTPGIGSDEYWQPCFYFAGQRVWARQINAEYADPEIINDGGKLWILGFKTEGPWTSFLTRNGGETEILGGVLNIGNDCEFPAIVNDQSNTSIVASTSGISRSHKFPNVIKEIHKDQSQIINHGKFPARYVSQFAIPLYRSSRA